MKFSTTTLLTAVLCLISLGAFGQNIGQYQSPANKGIIIDAGTKKNSYIDVKVNNIYVSGANLVTDMTFDLSKVRMKGNSELVVTPMFVDESGNSASLKSFTVAGRNRYYWLERNGKDKGVNLIKGYGKSIKDESVALKEAIPFQTWMNHANLVLDVKDYGCANCSKGGNEYELAETDFVELSYAPAQFIYVTPVAEAVKMREISARAYIDFVVNRTEINPDYRRNPVELAKIRATIDSVRNDKDITVKKLHISGTASPEGSYENNVRLAKGRTESLKNYVQNLYRFPVGVLTTSYEPVDWQGLADYLREVINPQFLPHASEILAIVNGNLEPYQRNNKIRSTYPKEYAWLLENVYPGLRHSDYRIEFEIKTYTEVSEILDVMMTQPNKLSLAELFVAANSQPEGSDLYNRAFELAVTMFPDDETANLNAGIAAMKRGDFQTAGRYLSKAGNSPETEYARAVSAFLQEDYDTARDLLSELVNSSNAQVAAQAQAMLNNMAEVDAANGFTWKLKE